MSQDKDERPRRREGVKCARCSRDSQLVGTGTEHICWPCIFVGINRMRDSETWPLDMEVAKPSV